MSRIRGTDTAPELRLRKALWAAGLRYRLGVRTSVGRPDIVMARHRIAIFIDGCFWHGCPDHYVRPRSSDRFWSKKLLTNFERDHRQTAELERSGWHVIRIWEHEVFERLSDAVRRIAQVTLGRRRAQAPGWRVVEARQLGRQRGLERWVLRELRNPYRVKRIRRRRTTRKWKKPSGNIT
jgi:DNA mismatch endonuclease (patch repair protein)